MKTTPQLNVFFDGGCPICRWEVDLYERMDKANHILWTDIESLADDALPAGKTREDLLGKFHALDINQNMNKGGTWHIGVDAFARIWKALPGLRHIAFIFSLPIIRQAAMLAYRGFLKWQSWHRRHRRAD